MMRAPFGLTGYAVLGCWIIIAVLEIANPQRFFRVLSLGRVTLPVRLVLLFRALGVLNAVGSVYLIVRYTMG